jgi:hypothetical protein
MTSHEQDKTPGPDSESKADAWAVDDDVLDIIIDAHVNEEVKDTLAATRVATITRQRRCRRLQLVSWQFAVSRVTSSKVVEQYSLR